MKIIPWMALAVLLAGCVEPREEQGRFYKEQGDYYYTHGRWEQAHAEYVAALGQDDHDVESAIALVYTCRQLAAARQSQGSPEAAAFSLRESLQWANHALTVAPGNPDARYAAALALADLGRRDEADAQLREALDAEPDFALAHLELARNHWIAASHALEAAAGPAEPRLRSAAAEIDAYLASWERTRGRPAADADRMRRLAAVFRDMADHGGKPSEEGRALLHLLDPDRFSPPVVQEQPPGGGR